MKKAILQLAVLSDTHGLLRESLLFALRAIEPLDHILHAGDVGEPSILETLRSIAPVTAIRGNIDRSGPCAELPATEALELAGCLVYLIHDLKQLDLSPQAAGIGVVISGHSHQPLISTNEGVLYLNPGSTGPKRFNLPISFAKLTITSGLPSAYLIELETA